MWKAKLMIFKSFICLSCFVLISFIILWAVLMKLQLIDFREWLQVLFFFNFLNFYNFMYLLIFLVHTGMGANEFSRYSFAVISLPPDCNFKEKSRTSHINFGKKAFRSVAVSSPSDCERMCFVNSTTRLWCEEIKIIK